MASTENIEMTEGLLKLASGQFDLTIVPVLRLEHFGFRLLSTPLGACSSLVELRLSNNKLTSVEGIQPLAPTLQRLFLQSNFISCVTPLQALTKLEVLHLEANQIAKVEDVTPIGKALVSLRGVHFQAKDGSAPNPMCSGEKKHYITAVLAAFPQCRCVDGKYFCKDNLNPKFVDLGADTEFKLPPTTPWVTESYFKNLLSDPGKVGLHQEKQFKALRAECKKLATAPATM